MEKQLGKKQKIDENSLSFQPPLRAGKPREWLDKLIKEEPKSEKKIVPTAKKSMERMEKSKLERLKNIDARKRISFLEKYFPLLHPEDIAELLVNMVRCNSAPRDALKLIRRLPHKQRIATITELLSTTETCRLEIEKEAVVLGMGNPKLLRSIIVRTYHDSSFECSKIKEFFDNEDDKLSIVSYITAGLASTGLFAIFYFGKMNIGAFVVVGLVAGAAGSYIAGGILALGAMGLGKLGLLVAGAVKFVSETVWWTTKYAYYSLKSKGKDSEMKG